MFLNMVIDSRVLWDRLVMNAINKYEYDAIGYDNFLYRMCKLGFNEKDIEDLVEEYEE